MMGLRVITHKKIGRPRRKTYQHLSFDKLLPNLQSKDRHLAAHILSCIDEDGLLTVPPIEIARYNHITLKDYIMLLV